MQTVNWKNLLSAVVLAVIVAVLMYLATLTDIAQISWHQMLNSAVFTAVGSLLKAFTTTQKGNFVGIVPVKEPSK